MFRFVRIVPVIAALMLAAGGVIACSSNDDDSSTPQPTTAAVQPTQASTAASPTPQPTTAAAQPTQSTGSAAAPTTSAGTRVSIVDFDYAPAEITAQVGQAITLNVTNNGQAPHTFTITGVTDSGTISPGQSKTVTFTPSAAGSLQFFCTIHGASIMSGKVTVQ
jgi:plastocyanin